MKVLAAFINAKLVVSIPILAEVEVPLLVIGAVTAITPDEPVAPVAPVSPLAPVAPVGPVGPCGPVEPVGPVGPGTVLSAPSLPLGPGKRLLDDIVTLPNLSS